MPSITRRTFQLAAPYWLRSSDRTIAWTLGLILIAMVALMTGLNLWITVLQKLFFDALEQRNAAAFKSAITLFFAGVIALVATSVVKGYVEQALLMRWRTDFTRQMLGRWLDRDSFYRIERDRLCDNPDQRIAQDIAEYIDYVIRLSLGFVANLGTLATMGWLLWKSAGPISFVLAGMNITIPGYLFWLAIFWGALQTVATHLAGRRLAAATVVQQSVEADFRFALTRVRDSSEQIALYRGGGNERGRLDRLFEAIRRNWSVIMRNNVYLNMAGSAFGVVAFAVPIIAMAPNVLAGETSLGTLMQDASAFTATSGAIAWLAWSYRDLFQLSARVQRLSAMNAAIDQPAPRGIETHSIEGVNQVQAKALHLGVPDGRLLTVVDELAFAPGERWIIRGPSGCGKSTLLRALAGLWPFRSGQINVPGNARVMFMPQKSYLPESRLVEVLAYPGKVEESRLADYRQALTDCRLAHLVPRLEEYARWGHELSPGEQQRIAFAQALLYAPDILFMDESTSSLDNDTEAHLMSLLIERLPNCTVVSVSHRTTLQDFHDQTLTLTVAGPLPDGNFGTSRPIGLAAP